MESLIEICIFFHFLPFKSYVFLAIFLGQGNSKLFAYHCCEHYMNVFMKTSGFKAYLKDTLLSKWFYFNNYICKCISFNLYCLDGTAARYFFSNPFFCFTIIFPKFYLLPHTKKHFILCCSAISCWCKPDCAFIPLSLFLLFFLNYKSNFYRNIFCSSHWTSIHSVVQFSVFWIASSFSLGFHFYGFYPFALFSLYSTP